MVANEQAKTEIRRKRTAEVTRTFRRIQSGATMRRKSEKVSAKMKLRRLFNAEANEGTLTDGLSFGHMFTQWTQGERSLFPSGAALLADPKHLNHEEDPLEEDDDSDDQYNLLLGSPGSNSHDGEDDGEARGPDGAVKETTDCDRSISRADGLDGERT